MNRLNETIAVFLYYIGIKPTATTDIADELSLGYGELDDNGFWQYQIPHHLLSHIVISFFWQYDSIYRSFFTIIKEYRSPYYKEWRNNKWAESVKYAKMICEFPKIKRGNYES